MSEKSTRQLLVWFGRIFRRVRLQSFINAMSGIVRVGLDFAFIWATKIAIDIATSGSEAPPYALEFPFFTVHFTLFSAGVTLVCIMMLQMSIGYLGRWIAALLGVSAQNQMQRHIFEHLLHSQWSGREKRHSGDVLNRLVSDSTTVVTVVTDTLPQALAVMVRLVCAFFFLFSMDAMLAVAVTVILPVFILLSRLYIYKMRAITRQVRDTDSRIQSILQESIQHRLVLKTLERIATMVDRLSSEQSLLRQHVRHRTLFSTTSNLILNVGFGSAYLFTFLWSVYRLSEGAISFGTMTAFIQLCGQIQGPFRELTHFIPVIIGSFTAAERLMELEESPEEEQGDAVTFAQGAGIRVHDVSYAYDAYGRQVLDHADFDFPPGSSTAILGETGAGKTTLIRLILALLRPLQGTVEIYDQQHRLPVSARTRCNMVYVPQGNSLFSGTIRWNLLMGNPEATESEMREALHQACADFVFTLPDGMDTLVGEGGAGLSEGQAQRIAIARALLRRGSILLMDEATSALDQQTEQQLLHNLVELQRTRIPPVTLIFITHRPAVVSLCTQAIELRKVL